MPEYDNLILPIQKIKKGDSIIFHGHVFVAMQDAREAHGYPDVIILKLEKETGRKGSFFIQSLPIDTEMEVSRPIEAPAQIEVLHPTEAIRLLTQISQDLRRQSFSWGPHRRLVGELIEDIRKAQATGGLKSREESVARRRSTAIELQPGDRVAFDEDWNRFYTVLGVRPLRNGQIDLKLRDRIACYETNYAVNFNKLVWIWNDSA